MGKLLNRFRPPYFTGDTGGGGGGGGTVTSVSASLPLISSGGATPNIQFNPATPDGVYSLNFSTGIATLIATNDFVNGQGITWNPLRPTFDLGGVITNEYVSITQASGNFSWNFYINQVFGLEQHTHLTQVGVGTNISQLQLFADEIGSGATSAELNSYSANNVSQVQLNADKGGVNPTTNVKAANGGDYAQLTIDKQKGLFGGANVAGVIGLQYENDYAANNLTNPRWIPDKGYVDNAIDTAGTLQIVTANGNITSNSMTVTNTVQSVIISASDIIYQDTSNDTKVYVSSDEIRYTQYDNGANLKLTSATLVDGIDYNQNFQAADGTIALLSDIPSTTNNILQNGNSFGVPVVIGSNDNFNLSFETNGTTKATITPTGFLGINEVVPLSYVHIAVPNAVVNGTKGIRITNTAATNIMLEAGNANDSYVGTISNSHFNIRTTNVERVRFDANTGSVTINNLAGATTRIVTASTTGLLSTSFDITTLLTSTYNQGRIFFVSKNGSDIEGLVGRIDRPFLTIQSAVTASIAGDTIYIFAGTYTENIALGGNIPDRTFIFLNAILNGTISNTIFNGCNYGRIIGIGNSKITGAITILGASNFELIKDLTLNVLDNCSLNYQNCAYVVSNEGTMGGTYENCTFTSTAANLILTYGASLGFKLYNCRINCNNFTTQVGGIDGGFGGQYIIQNCNINCTNFFSTRIAAVTLQITDSTIKASGNVYFLYCDNLAQFKVNIMNSVLQTACVSLEQLTTLNINSIVYAVSNKPSVGIYLGTQTIIPSLILI